MAYRGIDYLRTKLELKKTRVDLRYIFYEQKQRALDFGISTPEGFEYFNSVNGWCSKAVDALADRLQFDGFDNDNFNMMDIYSANNPDVIFDSAVLSSMIASCSFIYVAPGEKDGDLPRMQVIDGGNATGIIDDLTGMLTEGYAVLQRDDNKDAIQEAYFTKEATVIRTKTAKGWEKISKKNTAPYPLLVPIIYRPDAKRPFGHSRISRACMDICKEVMRTVKLSEISAQFYSYPQKYALGISEEATKMEKWKATMSSMLTFTKDEDGDKPVLGQFAQQSMAPYLDQIRSEASRFAGETGLTIDDLGFPSDNPSSSEAIKAAHENLRLTARKAQRCLGTGFLNAGYLAVCLRDNRQYTRAQVNQTKPTWLPIFEPDASTISVIGDGIGKINQAIPGYVDADLMHKLTGIK